MNERPTVRVTRRQRLIAVAYGIACHLSFAIGVGAMIVGLYFGLTVGRGPFTGAAAALFDLALLAQFAVAHSFLLSTRGRRLLARLVPGGIGEHMTTTTFALVSSLQVAITFVAWCPLGPVWWEPHGASRVALTLAYATSWLLLMQSMRDAGLAVQTGSLGWTAVARGRAPRYRDFPTQGLFRYVRQPVYVAFALTLWTGPVWTLDHLIIAIAWTLYCIAGPARKERRYAGYYGERFERYRELVPYWVPSGQKLDPVLLSTPSASGRRR